MSELKMWFPILLVGMLSPIYTVEAEFDQQCYDVCNCCIDRLCHRQYGSPNVCTKGCIGGHRGYRCYELCQYENCKSCGGSSQSRECSECYDGYYLGPNKDCTSQCPSNCKSCLSSTLSAMCTECKEGFYDKDGSTTCKYARCPPNCECNEADDCFACKKGYYDTSTKCNKQCPVNCLTCESDELCNECTSDNLIGDTCNMCRIGLYGEHCDNQCNIRCKDKLCERYTGECLNGCESNFNGSRCDACIIGKYGRTCNCELSCLQECDMEVCKNSSFTLGSHNCDVKKEHVTTFVLGSVLAVIACGNIVQAVVIFFLCRKQMYKSDYLRQSLNITYRNQPVSSDSHWSRPTQEDLNPATVTNSTVCEVIRGSDDADA